MTTAVSAIAASKGKTKNPASEAMIGSAIFRVRVRYGSLAEGPAPGGTFANLGLADGASRALIVTAFG